MRGLRASVLLLPIWVIGCEEPSLPTRTYVPAEVLPGTVASAQLSPDQTSVVLDPAGDATFSAPAFQDIVRGEISKQGGSFALLLEMAGSVPENPPLPPPATSEIWWAWAFNLDPAASPQGYPFAPGVALPADFVVYVSWDGTEFKARAIDRRPLLTGEEAIITPVPFSIDGAVLEAVLPSAMIGDPLRFGWGTRTFDWSGPLGTEGAHVVDFGGPPFNPWPPPQ